MSVPHGTPPPASSRPGSSGPDLNLILTLVIAGTGAVGYVLGFVDASAVTSMSGFALITAAGLGALRLLPKAPNTLYAVAPLSVYAALGFLQQLVGGLSAGIMVVVLLVALVQAAAAVTALLIENDVVSPSALTPKPSAEPRRENPDSGGFPAPPQWGPPSGPHPKPGWNPPSGPQPAGWNPPSGGAPAQPPQPAPPAQPSQPPGGQNPGAQPLGGQNPGGQPQGGQAQGGQPQGGQAQGGQNPGGQPAQPSQPPQSGGPSQPPSSPPPQGGQPGGSQGTRQMPHPGF
ncbi:DUF5336 domain-containing protein [Saccharopolyspora taberi]|uniref:Cell surface protein n=1 Tax=Saccharopolyspora taberi TaxID=60895 RepID=A0ABN3VID4_9PSEU